MQILTDTHIDFMKLRMPAAILSAVLVVVSLGSLVVRGLEFGIDFTGGTLIEVGYPQPVTPGDVRDALAEAGYGDAVVQNFGTARDLLIRIPPREGVSTAALSEQVFTVLEAQEPRIDKRRQEYVGPQVGEQLTEQGGLAMVYALIGILIYVSARFQWRLAVGSVTALAHDVIIVLGFFSVLGVGFDLTVLAAVLAVIGYSLNDTIVVFDRIRENFRKMRKGTAEEVVNVSLNHTLSRTLMTSLTTLLVLIALAALGGELIYGFATALIVGVVVGTYSSIYVASNAALALGISKEDLMPVQKEGEEFDEMP